MAGKIAPNIIKNGLIFYLDAANPKSYVSGSLIWYDLSMNKSTGSLVNGPTFNSGAIVFDGSNDYANFGNVFNTSLEDFAIDFWFYPTNNVTLYPKIITKGGFNTTGYVILYYQNTIIFAYNNPQVGISSLSIAYLNTWNHCVITRINNTITIYINTIANTPVSNTYNFSNNYNFWIGGSSVNGEYWAGRVGCVKYYNNKGLTSTEVIQNYNTQKTRFGL